MDDSDQDFTDLCSKLLKRVRKKPGESRLARRDETCRRTNRRHRDTGSREDTGSSCDTRTRCAGTQPASISEGGEQPVISGEGGGEPGGGAGSGELGGGAGGGEPGGGAGGGEPGGGAGGGEPGGGAGGGEPGGGAGVLCVSAGQSNERRWLAKEKVLVRMEQFKRAEPRRMEHHKNHCDLPPRVVSPSDGDEVLALRLQQELDQEAAESQTVDLEEGGLFFCQICHRDLSHLTPEGRTQHLNRCLDQTEPAPPPPGVSDCPICGKKFKSQKSRSAHLKRCSVDLGVSSSVLLQAVQRQAEENQTVPDADTLAQTGGTKRKGWSKPGLPARKKSRKKTDPLDEDTMMALALSSSLLDQDRESERPLQAEAAPEPASLTSGLKWRTDSGKGRGKRKKGSAPRPPLLLLVQDADSALTRLQERVSALLLQGRPPSPPTPTRRPSSLPGWSGAAPLWQKSTLQDGGSASLSDFYTPELREFIAPLEPIAIDAASFNVINKPESLLSAAAERTPLTGSRASVPPSSPSPPPSTPGGSQALRDLMDLAEDGMTLTQCGSAASGSDGKSDARITNPRLSGFVLDEWEEPADFTEGTRRRSRRSSDEPGSDKQHSVLFSRLASDLSSMVNNPQLSDVQLQVDSGDVFFAHSFMVYARCPLLAEMVHESGFGVQEEGVAAAQRVLISDVPGQAVLALLRYLYSARCSVPAPLRPHVRELASRFDLQELQQLCELHRDDEEFMNQEEDFNTHTEQALLDLLRSMWNQEDEDEDRDGEQKDVLENDRPTEDLAAAEIHEERVNEEELEEIYEFAATQRKREGEEDGVEKEEEEVSTEPRRSSVDVRNLKQNSQLNPDLSLDRSYSRLFSESWGVYEDADPPSSAMSSRTHVPQRHQSPLKPSGRTLLQSSGSVALPVLGQSPGVLLDSGSPAEPGPLSPLLHPRKNEPELIVLSDSGEEMEEEVLCSRGPSQQSPGAEEDLQSAHTQIKPLPVFEASLEKKSSPRSDFSPDHSSPLVDGSPEVSWLIPSTPFQRAPSSTSSSTQTRSSMCRTQLFPKADSSSSSSSSVFSSPAPVGPAGGAAVLVKQEEVEPCSSETDRSCDLAHLQPHSSTPLHTELRPLPPATPPLLSSRLHTELRPLPPATPPLLSSRLHTELRPLPPATPPLLSSRLHTELHPLPPATPPLLSSCLHTELRPLPPATPPLLSSRLQHRATSEERQAGSTGSFHLSPRSDLSEPPPCRGHQRSSGQRGRSVRSESDGTPESELTGRGHDGAQAEEANFSFMDEPPIAFNDSWGLDPGANPGRFSLRLEDSGGSSQEDRSTGPPKTSSSSTDCRPSAAAPAPKIHSGVSTFPACSALEPPSAETNSLLDSQIWDSWQEDQRDQDQDQEALPLSQRLISNARLKTPASHRARRRTLVPVTPMPHYSDMDTPDLKTKLNRFGVRPLPKRQMILKLKEIHQYTHQLVDSDSDGDAPPAGRAAEAKPPTSSRPASCAHAVTFKEPSAPAGTSPLKRGQEEAELLSTSQGSNASSTAEESDRSNPELCVSSDGESDSDGGVSASQVASRLQDRLQAVRSFILSDSELYSQILQYQPVVLSQLQTRLKAAGIRLGAAKLVDYLDSQCITFTTAKPGHSAPSRRRVRKTKAPRGGAAGRKKAVTAAL